MSTVRALLGHLAWWGRWCGRHRRWLAVWAMLAAVAVLAGGSATLALWLLGGGLVPGVAATIWQARWPVAYEHLVAGPARRRSWKRHCRGRWPAIAQTCGLSVRVPVRGQVRGRRSTRRSAEGRWVSPRLRGVHAHGHVLCLTIRARAGQTLEDLEAAAPRLASTLAAVTYRTRPVLGAGSGCTLVVELVMADALTEAVEAVGPEPGVVWEQVRLGRTQAGADWHLSLRGRHTLVAGCSGAGKGSVLWGVCCGLAPAVQQDVARLWGIDLKRGVELAMGSGLFSAHAYTPQDALGVLRSLMAVIDQRGSRMVGTTRLHRPVAGDPLHVLVIDELAALTAYAEVSIRREAERLLAEILTQGRALGVVVLACVQDPRKDVVGMRGLFTQTVALRLRSPEETAMVLGEGMAQVAPAHRIAPTQPGTAWVVEDTGAADRVRADFWPDALIRDLAGRYRTQVQIDCAPTDCAPGDGAPADPAPSAAPRPQRPVDLADRTTATHGTSGPAGTAGPAGPAGSGRARRPRKPRGAHRPARAAQDGAA